jgi:mycofactocin glycosyltransferase
MSVVNTHEHSDNATLRDQSGSESPSFTPSIETGLRAFPPTGRISLDRSTRLLPGALASNAPNAADHQTAAHSSPAPGPDPQPPEARPAPGQVLPIRLAGRKRAPSARVTKSARRRLMRVLPIRLAGRKRAPSARVTKSARRRLMQVHDSGVGSVGGSTVLLGGSPLRLMRLTGAAERVLQVLAGGATVAEAAVAAKISVRSAARLADRLLDSQLAHPVWEPHHVKHPATPHTSTPGANDQTPSAKNVAGLPFEPATDLSTVTLVIPVKDREVQLRRLLGSLHREISEGLHVVVVDDGSTDSSGDIARDAGAIVLRHAESQGPAAARNRGLDEAATPFVAFVDSDCTCTYGWLSLLLRHFNDPAVALAAPRICGLDVGTSVLGIYEGVRSPLDLGPEQALVVPRTRVSYVPSAALLARTNVLRALTGFSASLQVGEDVDLLWRLHAAGWRARYEPQAHVAHDHRVSWRAFAQRRYQYGTSAALLDARHPGQVAPLAVSGWSALGWLGLCTFTPVGVLGGLGTMAVTTALLPRKLRVVANPRRLALDLASRGHFGAGRQLAGATWRAYLPMAVLSALLPKPFGVIGRRILLASAIIPNVADWRSKRPKLDPIRYVGIRLLDDAAYGAGVWAGALKLRSLRALKPDFTSWPGKSKPSSGS